MSCPPSPPRAAGSRHQRGLALFAATVLVVAGCAGTTTPPAAEPASSVAFLPMDGERSSTTTPVSEADRPLLGPDSTVDDYVRYALLANPGVEAAFQEWRAASERAPQVTALPDPRVSFGYFVEEIETRTGPQEYRVGVRQSFPWPGTLGRRGEAAEAQALAEWRRFEAAQLATAERVLLALHDLHYLDRAVAITRQTLELLQSFEEVVRARYRVGVGSHPELVRVQVELGQLEDRLFQLRALRPSYVADLNSVLNRPSDTEVVRAPDPPERVVAVEPSGLIAAARESNPRLRALGDEIEAARLREEVARREGYPDFTVGFDYFFTGSADVPGTPGSGDDPILVTLGLELPIWRGRVNAAVRESRARRLVVSHRRSEETNRIASGLHRAWFEHTDADRRLRLFEETLIPKAEESLRSSLAGFRAGGTSFLDLLDTERTLLEFAISAERARADRGKALARLQTLVGQRIPTRSTAGGSANETEERP